VEKDVFQAHPSMPGADEDGEISADEKAFAAQMMARRRLMHVNDAATRDAE
jgi:hypothetical protein